MLVAQMIIIHAKNLKILVNHNIEKPVNPLIVKKFCETYLEKSEYIKDYIEMINYQEP